MTRTDGSTIRAILFLHSSASCMSASKPYGLSKACQISFLPTATAPDGHEGIGRRLQGFLASGLRLLLEGRAWRGSSQTP